MKSRGRAGDRRRCGENTAFLVFYFAYTEYTFSFSFHREGRGSKTYSKQGSGCLASIKGYWYYFIYSKASKPRLFGVTREKELRGRKGGRREAIYVENLCVFSFCSVSSCMVWYFVCKSLYEVRDGWMDG